MTHPDTYYDAKRALLAKAAAMRHSNTAHELRNVIDPALDALGYVAEPPLDARGRAVKVWAVTVNHILPEDPFGIWEREAKVSAAERGTQYRGEWIAFVVAPNKTAALDALFGSDRSNWKRPKTSDVGEVSYSSLGYEAASRAPADSVAVRRDETTFIVVPVTALDRKD